INNAASQAIMMRACVNGKVFGNTVLNVWHDGFHVTGASSDITIINNEVINGGDDAFAIVGYQNDRARPAASSLQTIVSTRPNMPAALPLLALKT
ncbi:hypothetical protein, partial [Burkholderia cepacia]